VFHLHASLGDDDGGDGDGGDDETRETFLYDCVGPQGFLHTLHLTHPPNIWYLLHFLNSNQDQILNADASLTPSSVLSSNEESSFSLSIVACC
jgi:hypothetical protein